MAQSNINVRVDSEVKQEAQELFSTLGLDMSTAINIFLRNAIDYGGIPFSVRHRRYNAATEAAMQETRGILDGTISATRYNTAQELFTVLDEEPDECDS